MWSVSLAQLPSRARMLSIKTAGKELWDLLLAGRKGRMGVGGSSKKSLPQGTLRDMKWANLIRFSSSVNISSGSLMGSDFTRKQVDWRHGSKIIQVGGDKPLDPPGHLGAQRCRSAPSLWSAWCVSAARAPSLQYINLMQISSLSPCLIRYRPPLFCLTHSFERILHQWSTACLV